MSAAPMMTIPAPYDRFRGVPAIPEDAAELADIAADWGRRENERRRGEPSGARFNARSRERRHEQERAKPLRRPTFLRSEWPQEFLWQLLQLGALTLVAYRLLILIRARIAYPTGRLVGCTRASLAHAAGKTPEQVRGAMKELTAWGFLERPRYGFDVLALTEEFREAPHAFLRELVTRAKRGEDPRPARRPGRRTGRPAGRPPHAVELEGAALRRATGETWQTIAEATGVSAGTIRRRLSKPCTDAISSQSSRISLEIDFCHNSGTPLHLLDSRPCPPGAKPRGGQGARSDLEQRAREVTAELGDLDPRAATRPGKVPATPAALKHAAPLAPREARGATRHDVRPSAARLAAAPMAPAGRDRGHERGESKSQAEAPRHSGPASRRQDETGGSAASHVADLLALGLLDEPPRPVDASTRRGAPDGATSRVSLARPAWEPGPPSWGGERPLAPEDAQLMLAGLEEIRSPCGGAGPPPDLHAKELDEATRRKLAEIRERANARIAEAEAEAARREAEAARRAGPS